MSNSKILIQGIYIFKHFKVSSKYLEEHWSTDFYSPVTLQEMFLKH